MLEELLMMVIGVNKGSGIVGGPYVSQTRWMDWQHEPGR